MTDIPEYVLDPDKWQEAKRLADLVYKVHSAYKSGYIVKKYKELDGRFAGSPPETVGLRRWFDEHWVNQRGEVGYQHKSDVYRPSVRITPLTPVTWDELSKDEIEAARRKKAKLGHVNRFKPHVSGGGDNSPLALVVLIVILILVMLVLFVLCEIEYVCLAFAGILVYAALNYSTNITVNS